MVFLRIEKIDSKQAPKAIGSYSQAVKANGFLFISGQIAIDPKTNELITGGIREQTELVFRNINAILKQAGLGFENVVKAEVFLKEISDFAQMNEIYSQKFPNEPKPARQTIQAAGLPKGAIIEISCIALAKK